MPSEVYVNDTGTIFESLLVDENKVAVDLSAATKLRMKFTDPSAVSSSRVAVLSTDGHDGKMRYITVDGDLDSAGWWQVESYVELPGGKWHSTIHRFMVRQPLVGSEVPPPVTPPPPSTLALSFSGTSPNRFVSVVIHDSETDTDVVFPLGVY